MTEHMSFGRHPRWPTGTRPEWFTYHDTNGPKRIRRLAHPFNQQVADRRYWGWLLGQRRHHVTAVLTVREMLLWSTTAPRPEAVLGDQFAPARVKTLFEAGHSIEPETQSTYPWALITSVSDAEALRFTGFLSLVAPERGVRLRLASPYASGEIIHFLGTLNDFVVQYGDQLRAANPRSDDNNMYFA